ncbi:MAG: ABC-2 transporter permease [Peptoniphilaceae bacterium]
MIRSLLFKDYKNLMKGDAGKYKRVISFIIIIYFLISYFKGQIIAANYLNIVSVNLIIGTFSQDDKVNCEDYLKASPIPIKYLAAYKFIELILISSIVFIINLLFYYSFKIIGKDINGGLIELLGQQIGILSIYFILIPLVYKFGIKNLIFSMLSTIGILVLIIMTTIKLSPNIVNIIENLSSVSVLTISLLTFLLVLIITFTTTLIVLKNKNK